MVFVLLFIVIVVDFVAAVVVAIFTKFAWFVRVSVVLLMAVVFVTVLAWIIVVAAIDHYFSY